MEAWDPGGGRGKRKGTWTTEHAENNKLIVQFLGRTGCARQDIPGRLSSHGRVLRVTRTACGRPRVAAGLQRVPGEGERLPLPNLPDDRSPRLCRHSRARTPAKPHFLFQLRQKPSVHPRISGCSAIPSYQAGAVERVPGTVHAGPSDPEWR